MKLHCPYDPVQIKIIVFVVVLFMLFVCNKQKGSSSVINWVVGYQTSQSTIGRLCSTQCSGFGPFLERVHGEFPLIKVIMLEKTCPIMKKLSKF